MPGWDCHGLPIEHKVDRELGAKKLGMSDLEIRAACRAYAEKYVGIQRDEFRRLGGFGTWDEPYLTMSPRYEADIAAALGKVVEQGLLYRERKSIRWCWHCRTALAEAELEYQPRRDPEIWVAFPADDPAAVRRAFGAGGQGAGVVRDLDHHPVDDPLQPGDRGPPRGRVRAARDRARRRGGRGCAGRQRCSQPAELDGRGGRPGTRRGPARPALPPPAGRGVARRAARGRQRRSVVVPADYVTLDTGTGLVHTAPGHGEDDFRTGKVEGIPIVSPVDEGGRYTDEVADLAGVHVFEANPRVTEELDRLGALLATGEGEHEYPHCWRCKQPVIFRATEQYFIALTQDAAPHARLDLRGARAGRDREGDVGAALGRGAHRRHGGEPLRVVRLAPAPLGLADHRAGVRQPVVPGGVARRLRPAQPRARSSPASRSCSPPRAPTPGTPGPLADFAPAGLACPKCGGTSWEKESDILDVWFDSGASHLAVCDNDRFPGLTWPADLYLEAHDQYRGWFQSSLLVGVVTHGAAPYRAVVMHGHVLDATGRKMSKSLGNVISPQNLIKEYGADVLRLWAASVDFREDMPVSKETMTRTAEAYRKIRNTLRFLLSNLSDFDPARERAASRCARGRWTPTSCAAASSLRARIEQAYRDYEFHVVYHALNNFCAVDLSAVYLDVLKDRLYCSHPGRAAAPLGADRALPPRPHAHHGDGAGAAVHRGRGVGATCPGRRAGRRCTSRSSTCWPTSPDDAAADAALRPPASPCATRSYKELEIHRQAGEFGKSLEAELVLARRPQPRSTPISRRAATTLEELCIVSQVDGGEALDRVAGLPRPHRRRFAAPRARRARAAGRCAPKPAGHPAAPRPLRPLPRRGARPGGADRDEAPRRRSG